MMFYSQADLDANAQAKRRATRQTALCALPFFALAAAAFALRSQLLCNVGLIAAGAVIIFLVDLRIRPARCYGRYLSEANSGLSHETVGQLVRVGADPVYQDNVNFFEVILNVYEDLSEEGERRFLLDCRKQIPEDLVGRDVVATSHGSFLLGIREARV